jgi:hypothetical protein
MYWSADTQLALETPVFVNVLSDSILLKILENRLNEIITPAIIVVLNPSLCHSERSEESSSLSSGQAPWKDLVTAWKGKILRIAQNDIIAVFTRRLNESNQDMPCVDARLSSAGCCL